VKPAIRLLAVDIDGTLLDPGFQISPANLEALQRAHGAGVEVVLVTGRRHTFALPIAEQLGLDLWLISSNGAITKSIRGELFHRDLLPAATARKVCGHMRDFRGNTVLTFDIETRGALVLETDEELRLTLGRWLGKNADFVQLVVPIEDSLSSDPVQLMFCGPIARMKQALAALASGGFDGQITVLRTEYEHRDLCIVDVLNQGCSKGHALERWARHRGLTRDQVMAIGDNYNDVEMLEFAGRPVIMGNAAEELKQNGWAVTLSNAESGVAAAVEEALGR
jgi:Cof subfamily protein (haloacid dehalogenase superfamily)